MMHLNNYAPDLLHSKAVILTLTMMIKEKIKHQ